MASAGNGGGGALKRSMGPLRVRYYIVMGAVAAAVVLATLRYMPGPAIPATTAASATTTTSGAVVRSAPAAAAAAVEEEGEEQAQEEGRKRKRRKGDGVVLFNFGDSNSDTGGVAAVMGIRIAPPEGRAYFHHPTGRLSDGRVILDFICESLSLLPGSGWFKSPIPLRFDSIQHSPFFLACSSNSPRCSVLGRRPSRRRAQRHSPRRRAVLVGLRLAAALARVIQD